MPVPPAHWQCRRCNAFEDKDEDEDHEEGMRERR
jgi:hypothetical protein